TGIPPGARSSAVPGRTGTLAIEQKRRTVDQRPGQILGPEQPLIGRFANLRHGTLELGELRVDGAVILGQLGRLLRRAFLGSTRQNLCDRFGQLLELERRLRRGYREPQPADRVVLSAGLLIEREGQRGAIGKRDRLAEL